MRSTRSLSTAIAGLVIGAMACAASANTIFTDSFETPVISPGYVNYQGSLTTGAATWTIGGNAGAGVDIIRDAYAVMPFPDGHQAIDLNGWDKGSITTSIATTDGQDYSLGFYLAANSNVTVTASTTVGAGTTTQIFTSDASAWTFHSMPFIGVAGGQTTISFTSDAPSGAGGPTLDMVTVSTVPLPNSAYAGFGLITGLGLLGMNKRRGQAMVW